MASFIQSVKVMKVNQHCLGIWIGISPSVSLLIGRFLIISSTSLTESGSKEVSFLYQVLTFNFDLDGSWIFFKLIPFLSEKIVAKFTDLLLNSKV